MLSRSVCAEACWLAPSTMPSTHCSTPCWLVQYYQCADWRAGCVSPRVAREARAARLSVNPAAHARRGGCSTGDSHCGNAIAVTASNFAYRPPSVFITESLVGGYGARKLQPSEIADLPFSSPLRRVEFPIRRGVNENVRKLHTFVTRQPQMLHLSSHRQSIGRLAPVPNPMRTQV